MKVPLFCSLGAIVAGLASPLVSASDLPFSIETTVAHRGFDGKSCWVHARAGAMPGEPPAVVMTMQKLLLSGSDVFYALNETRTTDRGKTWTDPVEHESFAREPFRFRGEKGFQITVCDFTPKWHAATGKLLGTGHTVVYEDNRVVHVRPRRTAYAVYDPEEHRWSPWETVEMPDEARFGNAGAGSVQRYDLPNGDILLPIYFKPIGERQYSTTVMRCRFDGEKLEYVEHGSELTVPVERGLYEPSVTRFGDRFYLTMRNDEHGYVAVGDDGLHYSEPKEWTFDDGEVLGNYNTQQHWVAHEEGLFLVYTRRGADNDHVFRHRAPLFIARVNPERLEVIRESERVLVPENGARLGNFGVTKIGEDETWVTVTEWMQGSREAMEKRGADNRVWVAKIHWESDDGGSR